MSIFDTPRLIEMNTKYRNNLHEKLPELQYVVVNTNGYTIHHTHIIGIATYAHICTYTYRELYLSSI